MVHLLQAELSERLDYQDAFYRISLYLTCTYFIVQVIGLGLDPCESSPVTAPFEITSLLVWPVVCINWLRYMYLLQFGCFVHLSLYSGEGHEQNYLYLMDEDTHIESDTTDTALEALDLSERASYGATDTTPQLV